MGEAGGWKTLGSRGHLGEVEHTVSIYNYLKKLNTKQAKQSILMDPVHHTDLCLTESWSNSIFKFINKEP